MTFSEFRDAVFEVFGNGREFFDRSNEHDPPSPVTFTRFSAKVDIGRSSFQLRLTRPYPSHWNAIMEPPRGEAVIGAKSGREALELLGAKLLN